MVGIILTSDLNDEAYFISIPKIGVLTFEQYIILRKKAFKCL